MSEIESEMSWGFSSLCERGCLLDSQFMSAGDCLRTIVHP
jgi:hypothetical protein